MIEYYKNLNLENLPYINDNGLICWEEFRDIPDYDGLYQASNLGRIKSLKCNKEKIFKSYLTKKGYLTVTLSGKSKQVHQIVAVIFFSHIPCRFKLVINHKNFIRSDNRVENLEIVTPRINGNQKHIKSSSKFTGVHWNKESEVWASQIFVNGILKHLGCFNDEFEASLYYESALNAIENGTEIQVKRRVTSSVYKGVHWSKCAKKWVAKITVDGKSIHLGLFEIESMAGEAYNKAYEIRENIPTSVPAR